MPMTTPFLFRDATRVTFPTRQCARARKIFAFPSGFPITFGTRHLSDPPKPTTATGLWRWVFVPSPSSPYVLSPQHLTPPALVSAQVWNSPAATALTPLARPKTSTGVWRSVVVPSPSMPNPLSPQHLAAPALVVAHV